MAAALGRSPVGNSVEGVVQLIERLSKFSALPDHADRPARPGDLL